MSTAGHRVPSAARPGEGPRAQTRLGARRRGRRDGLQPAARPDALGPGRQAAAAARRPVLPGEACVNTDWCSCLCPLRVPARWVKDVQQQLPQDVPFCQVRRVSTLTGVLVCARCASLRAGSRTSSSSYRNTSLSAR